MFSPLQRRLHSNLDARTVGVVRALPQIKSAPVLRRIHAALLLAPLRDPSLPGNEDQLARSLGTLTATLRPYLAGHRGDPPKWGERGGAVSLERIAAALKLPADAFGDVAPLEIVACACPKAPGAGLAGRA